MKVPLWIALFAALTLVGSLAGGMVPRLMKLTHSRLQVMMSLVAGLMLGVAMFHMLPHAFESLQALDTVVTWMVAGLVITFFLQRFFHFHQHELPPELEQAGQNHVHGPACDHAHEHSPEPEHARAAAGPTDPPPAKPHSHSHGHSHDHGHSHSHGHDQASVHELSWVGIGIGLVVHTLMDGVALSASVSAEHSLHPNAPLPGFDTFLVIFLHKPLDAMAIAALMLAGGWSLGSRRLVNLLFSLICPIGAGLFYFGAKQFFSEGGYATGVALAISAGVFLCIALSDLLPEVQFHSHDRIKLSLSMLLGLAIALGISKWEHAGHSHDHGPAHHHTPPNEAHDHGHDHP